MRVGHITEKRAYQVGRAVAELGTLGNLVMPGVDRAGAADLHMQGA